MAAVCVCGFKLVDHPPILLIFHNFVEAATKGYQDQTPRKTNERWLVSSGQYSSTKVLGSNVHECVFEMVDHRPLFS